MPNVAIFDLDGTLLDSVDLHALAWHEAMAQFGHDISFEQARSQIGKGGDKLIPEFLSDEAQRDHGKELEQWRGKRFQDRVSATGASLFRGPKSAVARPRRGPAHSYWFVGQEGRWKSI